MELLFAGCLLHEVATLTWMRYAVQPLAENLIMTEAALSKKCTTYCRLNNVLVWKMNSESQRGFPDLLLLFPGGHIAFVELKHPSGGGRLSALQISTIKKMTNHGADVHVIDNYEAFKTMVTQRLDAPTTGSDHFLI